MTATLEPRHQEPLAGLLPIATGRRIATYVRGLIRDRWPLMIITVVVMIIASLLGLAGPVAIGWITQAIADRRHPSAVVAPMILLAGAAVASAVVAWLSEVLLARLVLPAVARLREEAVSAAVELPIDTVEAAGTGDLVSRVSGDVDLVSDAASGALGSFVGAALSILTTLAGLATLDWRFALAGLLAVPIQAHTLRWYLRNSRPVYAAGRIADGRRASALLTGFGSLTTLRALRLGDWQRDRIEAASADSMAYEFRATRIATRFFGRLNLAEFVGLGAILLVAFLLVREDLASIGAATAAALFFARLFDPINTVLGVFDSIQQAGAGLARLIGVADQRRRAGLPGHPASTGPGGLLVADHLRFAYGDGPDAVRDVGLRLEPGRTVAVVGTTGSGKSTVASLLAGIREPRSGTVEYNGVGLERLDLPQQVIALVTQETHVFAGSVADNLRLAVPEASDHQLRQALDAVGATAWVEAMADGIDTAVGGGGVALTASQAQQMALARVLLLDPPVVILDEATAEAGSDAARALDRAAAAITRGRSAVVVAHRLSQVRGADLIIVMADGRIAASGTHEELLLRSDEYADLWAGWSGTRSFSTGRQPGADLD
ncbi:multidrug ABC transporter permease [Microlunatus endophyticus]|uniref:Multidrug ABC transporter permease n=1 Tax=Microlunatus endophyticus TaxID=1716077 RepID=A0A917SCN8_9ACTN|nr:ABC transporter ATP-binding protein [Microlunatus endophyticus]GGL72824.1 multidrug ABC transporter permease [Microlunatus endophyticus]